MKSNQRTVLTIAATFLYFLLFSQFGFMHFLEQYLNDQTKLIPLGWMSLGGIWGSLLARNDVKRHLKQGLLMCGWSALAIPLFPHWIYWSICGFFSGWGLGLVTTHIAGNLPRWINPENAGKTAGWGVALAYFLANFPPIFNQTPQFHRVFCGLLMLAVSLLWPKVDPAEEVSHEPTEPQTAMGWRMAPLVLALMTLVWFDSAAFTYFQSRVQLKALSWGSTAQLWSNGLFHALAALAAGFLITRYWRGLLVGSWSLLAIGALIVQDPVPSAEWGHLFYVTGVSFYSVGLVCLPTLWAGEQTRNRFNLAFWIYALAGWIGSVLGIGMIQDLGRIPPGFFFASAMLMIVTLLPRYALVLGLPGLLGWLVLPNLAPFHSETDPVERGRQVYIREGCIHCHSQYIRPLQRDMLLWGEPVDPATAVSEKPPLLGNRRQGPDLATIGARRGATWLRLHQIDPRTLSPGSRMPDYSALFLKGNPDGPDLITYLSQLGREQTGTLWQRMAQWQPQGNIAINQELAQKRYLQFCAPCHGEDLRGEGPLARNFQPRPRDLIRGNLIFQSETELRLYLARVIRFGIPGSEMPGHETWTKAQISSLADWLAAQRAEP